jgi:hypothetical protein
MKLSFPGVPEIICLNTNILSCKKTNILNKTNIHSWGNGGIAMHFLRLSMRWKWVVSFMA